MPSARQRGAFIKDSSLGSWAEERRPQLTAATGWMRGSLGGFGLRHPWVCLPGPVLQNLSAWARPSPVRHQSRCCCGSEVPSELEGVSLDKR